MLEPLLSMGPFAAITLISFFVSLVITLIYKFTTNQATLALIKSDMERLRKEMKGTQDAKRMAEVNRQLMEKTMEQFRASMRPMLITMIPALLVIGWMQNNVAYRQVLPGEEFNTSVFFEKSFSAGNSIGLVVPEGVELLSPSGQAAADKVSWRLKGVAGRHELQYHYGAEAYSIEVIITDEWEHGDVSLEKEKSFLGFNTGDAYPIRKDSQIKKIVVENQPVRPFGPLRIFGWNPGWLASYIALSLLFSLALRSALRVH
ncbi:DUF106 domain-containing protein [Candidatus Woesearchaeota archaeon]|nr:DUF106 domain-containing protein [Candidatus Woesearchaeota archaeon]